MAERKGQRLRQSQAGARARTRALAPFDAPGRAESPEQLRAERDALQAELTAARAEIAELRARQEEALNRVAWVIDSLNSLEEAGP